MIEEVGYKKRKNTVDYRNEINRIFKYDISNDVENIHPNFICHTCASKLSAVRSSKDCYAVAEIAVFTPHEDQGCLSSNPYLRRNKNFHHKFSIDLVLYHSQYQLAVVLTGQFTAMDIKYQLRNVPC